MKDKKRTGLRVFSLVCVAGLLLAGFSQVADGYTVSRLKKEPLNLDVPVFQQAQTTSCGEAVIVMVYNYAFPQTALTEQEVIEYATTNGYFTPGLAPFTSPAHMVKIARNYAAGVTAGNVTSAEQGLRLLIEKLQDDEPVIIDVLSHFADPESEAHFVVVTGITVDPARENAIVIHYNDPLTGTKESADWAGETGVWNAWQNNGDPGGAGWWMVISRA